MQRNQDETNMKIGIIVAMEKELRQLKNVLGDDPRFRLMQCGIGKVNAALGAQQLINEFRPDAIVSTGCAGGNGDDLQVQDVVVGAEVCYHDVYCGTAIDNTTQFGQVQGLPLRFKADEYLLSKAPLSSPEGDTNAFVSGGNEAPSVAVHKGLIVTGDWFVDSREKMREIVANFPEARAVDMESAAIAQACYLNEVPFISFRVVSDIPLRDTDASQYHDFWNTIAENSFHITRKFVESL